jgi:hypothetical protein
MRTATYDKLVADAKIALQLWQAHPELKLSDTTLAGFQKAEKDFEKVLDEVKNLESQLGAKMARRDDSAAEIGELITRTRSAVRGYFGPDSPEYAQLGCTRVSDRKRPNRRNGNGSKNGNGNGNAHGATDAPAKPEPAQSSA